ncbi:hypothetical protein ACJ41O_000161 [Fusarium nematophilum]
MPPIEYHDSIIIGAGIAGINAAYRFQQAFPGKSYVVLEAREEIGGTWSLFQYPGIRSDSDLYTLSFPWDPWSEDVSIAKAESIMAYLRNVTKKHGLDPHFRFNHKVASADWDSSTQQWYLKLQVQGEEVFMVTKYLILGTGYYDAEHPYQAHIEGLERFKGDVLHPQFWPKNYDYSGKKIVIIGSGATAITMLPAMHEKAEHITMLQRSPGYIISLPQTDWMRRALRIMLPKTLAISIIRLRYIVSAYVIFILCKMFPMLSRRYIQRLAKKQLPKAYPVDPHFEPKYGPWDQRLCIAPDGDFYKCLGTGRASVTTSEIRAVTEDGITLTSGESLPADVIVTATGLRMRLLGHIEITLDGKGPVQVGDHFTWRGCMLQDIPNLFALNGYFLASYTLGIDNSCMLIMRILKEADHKDRGVVLPRVGNPASIKPRAAVPLTSGYVKRGLEAKATPKLGESAPWTSEWLWFTDWFRAREHATENDAWLIIDGVVWDVTGFAEEHPGGADIIITSFGKDASKAYNAVHSPKTALRYFGEDKIVGELASASSSESSSTKPDENSRKPDLRTLVNLHDIEKAALDCLPPLTRAQVSGGANDNRTTNANASSFQDILLRPRVLQSARGVDCSTRILGRRYPVPIFNAPASLAKLLHPDGELALARGLAAGGSTIVIPTMASFLPDEIVDALPKDHPFFFQLYMGTNRDMAKKLLESVMALKPEAIIVTVDLPVIGKRDDVKRLQMEGSPLSNDGRGNTKPVSNLAIDPNLSWRDIQWIREFTGLPVFVKGIQTAEDAQRALAEGCAGIYISNHGGRAVDTAQPAILTLMEINMRCPEVLERMDVFIDGGIRRGTDILKAICLGATAVCLGRPFLYALTYGQKGVEHALTRL